MDVPRTGVTRRRWVRRIGLSVVTLLTLAGATLGLSRLQPAVPSVDRSAVVCDQVRRGLMLRQARGTGKLVPEDVLWVSVGTSGRVERIPLQPGVAVRPDTVLVDLSNPELVQDGLEAAAQVGAAEARLRSHQARLQNELLSMEAAVAKLKATYNEAVVQREVDEKLFRDNVIAERILRLSRTRVDELAKLIDIEERRLAIFRESLDAQMATSQSDVERAKAVAALKKAQVDALVVRAGVEGVLEQLRVELGQRVTPGLVLAKVTNPKRLKAQLQVPEMQATDVQLGQRASVDTRSTVLPGRVVRVDPAAVQGTVTVDVSIETELPREARPDLSVDGTVELERLENVLFVGRPVFGQAGAAVDVFKVDADGRYASRVRVRLGRSSVNTIEILEGLSVGDQVILSDMREWEAFDRIRVR